MHIMFHIMEVTCISHATRSIVHIVDIYHSTIMTANILKTAHMPDMLYGHIDPTFFIYIYMPHIKYVHQTLCPVQQGKDTYIHS